MTAFAMLLLLMLPLHQAWAADKFTIQLRWLPQAQFIGYYVAKEKGYYTDAKLDVTIQPGGPNVSPVKALVDGKADVSVEWLSSALAARERGSPVINVAQVFNRSGQMLTCKRSRGIARPQDLRGKRIGVWFGGLEYPFFSLMNKLGIKATGADAEITAVPQGFDVDPLLKGQVDCVSTMIYNEFWKVVNAGINPLDLVLFQYEDQGVAMLEDGMYVNETRLNDPVFVDRMRRFVLASLKGWRYAVENRDEAVDILLKEAKLPIQQSGFQLLQLKSITKLIDSTTDGSFGRMDPKAYRRTVDVLLKSGGEKVITKDPGNAGYTDIVWVSPK
jgi:NitT/TauT family transport system substrate-binding protein